jgi:hypothetical protein
MPLRYALRFALPVSALQRPTPNASVTRETLRAEYVVIASFQMQLVSTIRHVEDVIERIATLSSAKGLGGRGVGHTVACKIGSLVHALIRNSASLIRQ